MLRPFVIGNALFRLLFAVLASLWLSSCVSFTSLNTAKTLEKGEYEITGGGGVHSTGSGAIGSAVLAGRMGFNPWLDGGLRCELYSFFPITTADLKFGILDEDVDAVSLALQPGVSIGFHTFDFTTGLLVSRRFDRYEPVVVYRPHLMTSTLFSGFYQDVFLGCRIHVAGPFYVFPEVGASFSFTSMTPAFHGTLGLSFLF